jgi:phosphonate metabolism-associated iron-containing alcohol dehydrogenase
MLEASMWQFQNPVRIRFGEGRFDDLAEAIRGRRYVLVSYNEPPFDQLCTRLRQAAGAPAIEITDVAPNPDLVSLAGQAARIGGLQAQPELIVAVGGGSVIDSAKVFAAAAEHGFDAVRSGLERGDLSSLSRALPLIAVPTTAGTGSEVTPWATVWDKEKGNKYSLAMPALFPELALIDPALMSSMPRGLTVSTALDALSHALESTWNKNANPVSARFAIAAVRDILEALPQLVDDLSNIELRSRLARAALYAGLAFSNTKTAIAHSLSYPITLHHGVVHGIACSFTLPLIMRSLAGIGGTTEAILNEMFDAPVSVGADRLEHFLNRLGVATDPKVYGVTDSAWDELLAGALRNERGQNFIGSGERILAEVRSMQNREVAK